MSDAPIAFALRELRQLLTHRGTVLGVIGSGLILGISGPFGTNQTISTLPRIAYWTSVVFATFSLGMFVQATLRSRLRQFSIVPQIAISTLAVSAAVVIFLLAFNWAVLGNLPRSLPDFFVFVGEVGVISLIVITFLELGRSKSVGIVQAVAAPILDRLPVEKRGPLVALSVNDHYVDVVTTKGQQILYMRLADAIREVGETSGLKVHRSHWVALDQVVKAERKGEGAILTTSTGNSIPVSRANLAAVKDAGLLPKG